MDTVSFWNDAWERFDPARAAALAKRLEQADDPIVSYLVERGARTVCDAGCGCGVWALRLAAQGFAVSGFDVSPRAVALTKSLLASRGFASDGFRTAGIVDSGFADGQFDAAVARDVLDHLPLRAGAAAVDELLRITRPGGCVLLTLDAADDEYESEQHTVNADGDYLYTDGKWAGMIFHPYTQRELEKLTRGRGVQVLSASAAGLTALLEKA